MAINVEEITNRYAIYNGDSCEVLPDLDDESIHLSVYSPPFADLYNYSSSERDLSNCKDYDEFMKHYEFIVREIYRVTLPGRETAVHCMDIPLKGDKGLKDFPGDIIRLHERLGFVWHARYGIWKEPLRVAIRTRSKGLMHRQLVKDASLCNNAGADYVLVFRKEGQNPVPITNEQGLLKYCGEREIPEYFDVADPVTGRITRTLPREAFYNWTDPRTNKLSHWIWQQYASSYWDDIRIDHVLPYRESREPDDEKHVCPLQLDVIERTILLWSNPGEIVLTPFLGVGSEVYAALINGRRGIGIELKESYFKQAVKNIRSAMGERPEQSGLFWGLPNDLAEVEENEQEGLAA